jgi:undecaprenyl-diphosphatase
MLIASLVEFAGAYSKTIAVDILFAGIITSLVAGYISIAFLMSLLKKNKLHWFGYYCVLAGVVFISLILFK